MPSIVAVPYPDRGHVLLEINFADVPTATHVCVTATDTVTGVTRPLHPYVSYNSDGCQALSCGQAVMWDTEISCGHATEYCATATDTAGVVITEPAAPLIVATFSTVAVASWPPADTGQTWTTTGGAAADYSGTGTRGQMAITSTGVTRLATMPLPNPNVVAEATFVPAALALTQPTEMAFWLRGDAAGLNGYRVLLRFLTTGQMDAVLERVDAGVSTALNTRLNWAPYTALSQFRVLFQAWGTSLVAVVWDVTTPQPAANTLSALDSTYPGPGTLNLTGFRTAGNTNGTINMQFDDLLVADVCAEAVPVEVCTETVTIECDGCFRLGNPVRPCDDVRICLCTDGVECGGTGGLAFIAMTPENRSSNSGQLAPINDIYPIPTSRPRMKPTSVLTVVPTSFVARDALIELLAPGEPLLFRTTPEFGIGDRYLDIGDVGETYQIADMTMQPRIMNLPNAEVRAPVGPSLGVCGARVIDLCDVYDTWDEMVAAGLTYGDLLRGDASDIPSGLATWDEINAENANWAALQVAETDWSDVLDGD